MSLRVVAMEKEYLKINNAIYFFKATEKPNETNSIIHVFVSPPDKSVGHHAQFILDKDGLIALVESKLVILMSGILMTGEDMNHLEPSINQDRLGLAGAVVDWTKKIVTDNKYTPLPTASFE